MSSRTDLSGALTSAIEECIGGAEAVAVAYSGGLDSTLVAAIAARMARVRCYACAVKGSHDWRNLPTYADEVGCTLSMVDLDAGDVRDLVREAATVMRAVNPTTVAYSVPIMCVLREADEDTVLTGSVADEIFGGYAKYAGQDDPGGRMAEDLEKALAELGLLRAYAQRIGKRLEAPFASEEVVGIARRYPPREMAAGDRKLPLRDLARAMGLAACDRPKKAAQYSSGVLKEMRRQAAEAGRTLEEWVAEVSEDRATD